MSVALTNLLANEASWRVFPAFRFDQANDPVAYEKLSLQIFAQLGVWTLTQAKLVCRQWKILAQRMLALKVKGKFSLTEEEKRRMRILNRKLMDAGSINREASHYLSKPQELKAGQHLLLKIVKLSKINGGVKTAAANALMILKAIHFSLVGLKLKGIQVPRVRLPGTVLDKVDLTGADISGADLTDCSLVEANLERANMQRVQFGQRPYLSHADEVVAMALSPQGKHLASLDRGSLYVWDLETFQSQQKFIGSVRSEFVWEPSHFLVFASDEKLLFRASSTGEIEIWMIQPLQRVWQQSNQKEKFFFLALTHEGTHLVSAAKRPFQTTLCLWEISQNDGISPSLKPLKQIILRSASHFAFSPEASVLAVKDEEEGCIKFYSLPRLEIKQEWTLPLPSFELLDMTFNPQGTHLIITCIRKYHLLHTKAIAWDIKTKEKSQLFAEKQGAIKNFQFVPRSSSLAYQLKGSGQDVFCIRDSVNLRNSKRSRQLPMKDFLSNGNYLFYSYKARVLISSLENFSAKIKFPLGEKMIDVRFSSDEEAIYLLSDKLLSNKNVLYEYKTLLGEPLRKSPLNIHFKLASSWIVSSLRFLLKEYQDRVAVLKEETYHSAHSVLWFLRAQLEPFDEIEDVILSKDNLHLVVAERGQLKLYEMDSNKKLKELLLDKGVLACIPYFYEDGIEFVTLSPTIFPVATLATKTQGSTQINLWRVDWQKQQAELIENWPSIKGMLFYDDFQLFLQNKVPRKLFLWNSRNQQTHMISVKGTIIDFALADNSSLLLVVEELPKFEASGYMTRLSIWDVKQKKRLESQFLPFKITKVRLSPLGKFVLGWKEDLSRRLKKLYLWERSEGKLHLLWKIPQQLTAWGLKLQQVQNLDPKNALLLSQLKSLKE